MMVTGSYFLFKCPWQKFKVGNSVLIGRFFFLRYSYVKSENLGLNRTRGLVDSTYLCIFRLGLEYIILFCYTAGVVL